MKRKDMKKTALGSGLFLAFVLCLSFLCALSLGASTQTIVYFENRITTDAAEPWYPAVSGNVVVWEDYRNGDGDVYIYDLSTETETRITADAHDQLRPVVSGNTIVWHDNRNGNWDIYTYDISSGTETQITTDVNDQFYAAISGNNIVWEDNRNGATNWEIYAYDLSTKIETRVTTNPAGQFLPAVSDNIIVWYDYRTGDADNADIYAYDLSAKTEVPISTNTAQQWHPAVSGNIVVWEDYRNGNADIYTYDLSTKTETQITADTSDQLYPEISGNTIVWEDYRNGNEDVYAFDLATKTEFPITTNSEYQEVPRVEGNIIVWQDWRNGGLDIYLRSPTPTSNPTATPTPTPLPTPTPASNPSLPTPELTVTSQSATSYSTFRVDIEGKLTHSGTGIGEAGITLSYSITGGASWNELSYANTATDGSFSVTWMPAATGNYLIKATYGGNEVYSPTSIIVNLAMTQQYARENVFSVTSNSTVSSLTFNSEDRELSFSVTGPSGTSGFADVYFAKTLVLDPAQIRVQIDGTALGCTTIEAEEAWLLHFTYSHSTHDVIVSLGVADADGNLFGNWMVFLAIAVITSIGVAAMIVVVMKVGKKKTEAAS